MSEPQGHSGGISRGDRSAEEFKEFVYIVSHDLSAPVRGMVEFSKLLKEEQGDALNDDGKLYCSLIVENGQKLQSMLTGLLEYSRVNTAAQPPVQVDCNAVLNDCRLALKDKIDGGTLVAGNMPVLQADAAQMRQLFLALLENAFKFRKVGVAPQVEISAAEKKEGWMFRVRDNGIGVGPEFHKRIFSAFQRLHTDGEYPGVGMGLTLAKRIVERHGGSIGIDPAWNNGVCIWFTLARDGTA